MEIRWTRLPFAARNREEFSRGLARWLGEVFYDTLPAHGFEVREEQIYTAFQMARALTEGRPGFAEAGPGTGKTFAYLLSAVCYARFRGKPVVIASATGALQAQLMGPKGDIRTLSDLLGLEIDARLATDPGEYLCQVKADRLQVERPMTGWKALHNWTRRTKTGARSEVPQVPDELWAYANWDPTLPCDTCRHRGTCHVMAARRHYRAAADLIVTDHALFARDLLTRTERQQAGVMPLLPAYSAVLLDEGHHLPEVWQKAQGHELSARRLLGTLEAVRAGYTNQPGTARGGLAEARWAQRERLGAVLLTTATQATQQFLETVAMNAAPGEGKRHIARGPELIAAARRTIEALDVLQDELVTEEAMQEGTSDELRLRAYQARLDGVTAALELFMAEDAVTWLEGESVWAVPREPLTLYGPGRLPAGTPALFSSATLEPEYIARVLRLPATYAASRVGVPFNLAEQVLIYQPSEPTADPTQQVADLIRAAKGRTLVLLTSRAKQERYRQTLNVPFPLLWEGDTDRGAMLDAFRKEHAACLIGTSFWEGVDVPGESLSCVIIPRLPFPAHDPLILERRAQAAAAGADPFMAVDLPEMLLKLRQGMGRLIRTARDRGVLALLDQSYHGQPWAGAVEATLPEGALATTDLDEITRFLSSHGFAAKVPEHAQTSRKKSGE